MKKLILATAIMATSAHAQVELDVCGQKVMFDKVPERAVANDINMLSIMLELGLKPNMAGYSGVSAYEKTSPEIIAQVSDLPNIAQRKPTIENLLNVDADFYFAGWNYGMNVGGPVTPEKLAAYDIKTYVIKESCSHVQQRETVSLSDTFYDINAIGKIFDIEDKANKLIDGYQARLKLVQQRVQNQKSKTVFVYDSGEDKPFTAGGLAVPNAIIKAAGGTNVMESVHKSWTQVNWESVVEADPEHIVIIDYSTPVAADKIDFLKRFPATTNITAVRNDSFTVLSYAAATPGIENIDSVEKLAGNLYPELFKK